MSDRLRALKVVVSEKARQSVESVARDVAAAIGSTAWEHSFFQYLGVGIQVDRLKEVARTCGRDLRKCKVVEIGSGCGMFVCVANKLGLEVFGVGPSANSYQRERDAATDLLEDNGVSSDRYVDLPEDNRLPFEEGFADICVAFDVLEHVPDPKSVMAEAVRVVKPKGFVFSHSPSCGCFTEVHYGIPWIPVLNRRTAPVWVKLFGRNPEFLREMNFLSHRMARKFLESMDGAQIVQIRQTTSGTSAPQESSPDAEEFCSWLDSLQLVEPFERSGTRRRVTKSAVWVRKIMAVPIIAPCLRVFGIKSMDPIKIVLRKLDVGR